LVPDDHRRTAVGRPGRAGGAIAVAHAWRFGGQHRLHCSAVPGACIARSGGTCGTNACPLSGR
jgi:hypothetical protein